MGGPPSVLVPRGRPLEPQTQRPRPLRSAVFRQPFQVHREAPHCTSAKWSSCTSYLPSPHSHSSWDMTPWPSQLL